MSIIRISKRSQFLVIAQTTVNDLSISWEAKGLLTYLLGRPDNWTVSPTQLVKYGKSGRDKVYKILKELTESGYIKKCRVVNKSTKQVESWEWIVYETPNNEDIEKPHPEKPDVVNLPVDNSQKPHPEKPHPDFPDLVKPTLTNTDNKLILNKPIPLGGLASPSDNINQTGLDCDKIDSVGDSHNQIDFVDGNKKPHAIESLASVYIAKGDQLRFIKVFGSKISKRDDNFLAVSDALERLSDSNCSQPLMADVAIPYCMAAIKPSN